MSTRSEIWDHFSVAIPKQKAKCNYCEKIVCISGGGTDNLIRHLRVHHSDLELSVEKGSADDVSKIRRSMKRSKVWDHFSVVSDGKAKCSHCHRILSYYGGGSSNLARHIRLQHQDICQDFLKTSCEITADETDEKLMNTKCDILKKCIEKRNPLVLKRSEIWKHFTSVSNGRAKCIYCLKRISYSGGGPGNLSRHIRTNHRDVFSEFVKSEVSQFQMENENSLPDNNLNDITENPSILKPTTALITSTPKEREVSSPERKPIAISFSRKLDELLAKTIVKQYYPVKMVEDPNFKQLVHMLCPNYEVPTGKAVSNLLLPRMFNDVKKKVESMLIGVEAVCITIDRWTSNTQQSYVDVSSHFLSDSQNALQSCFLGCIPFDSSQTSESLGTLLRNEVESWIFEEKVVCVVTDNDPSIIDAVKFNNWEHLPCFAHTLNVVIGEGIAIVEEEIAKVKNIVAYLKRSPKAMNLLIGMQEQLKLPQTKLKEDYPTKWISTYEMISSVIQLKEAIVAALAVDKPELNYISEREWKVLEETLEIFKIFDIVTKEISAEKNLPLSKVMLIINAINTHLVKMSLENTFDETTAMIAILQNSISQGFKEIESNELVATATILDPRFKRYGFTSQSNFDRCLQSLKGKFQPTASPIVSENTTEAPAETSLIWEDFDIRVQSVIGNTNTSPASTSEVDKYLNEPVIRRTEDPLKWWDERKHIYPNLYRMIRQVFCIVATSVSPERVFSNAGLATDERRSSLKAENTAQCLFLNYNL